MHSAATARPFVSFRRVPGQYVLLRQCSRAAGVLHFRRHAFLPHSSEHNGAQIFHCPAFEARYLYLRYGEDPRAVALRQAVEKPEIDHLLLLFRQTLDRRTERDALQYAILLPIVTEHVLKCETFVSALALQTLRRSGRGLRLGDLFHAHAAFRGDLGKRRLPAERLLQTAPCRMDLLRAL